LTDALRFERVTLRRSGKTILEAVDWIVGAGEHWAVLGPNGAGKTTLLRIASAQIRPTSGAATVLGGRLGRVSMPELRRRIGVVEPALGRRFHPVQTALDVVVSGFSGTILPEEGADEARALKLLDDASVSELSGRPFSACSEGERARILLARALAANAELLVLDEPAVGLDLPGRELLLRAFDGAVSSRTRLTTVAATHHIEELSSRTTHVLLMRAGRVVEAGPLRAVLTESVLATTFGLPLRITEVDGRYLITPRT
jgi:iron complex transport system ATP-binding protein